MGCIEKKVNGYTTIKDGLQVEKDHKGHKQAKGSHLIHFYKKRIPCSCLERQRNKPKEVIIMGYCSFEECAERKPIKNPWPCVEAA